MLMRCMSDHYRATKRPMISLGVSVMPGLQRSGILAVPTSGRLAGIAGYVLALRQFSTWRDGQQPARGALKTHPVSLNRP